MSTATKEAGTVEYASLRDFLTNKKRASLTSPPSPESTIPNGDGGKAPSTGAHFAELTADIKGTGLKDNVESQTENEETGHATSEKLVPNSGLEHTTADQEDSQTRAIKTVKGENEKMSALNLTVDADLNAALEALNKAAAALPGLIAQSGVKAATPVASVTPAKQTPEETAKWAAEQQAVANVVEHYRKLGADHGRVLAEFLRGHDEQLALLKKAEDDGTMAQMMATQGGAGDVGAAPPPPMDPAAGGGAPPPMDPSAGGGMPPMDPAAAGGAPPPDGGAGAAGGGGAITPEDMANALAESGMTPDELAQVLELLKQKLPGAEMQAPDKEKAAALIGEWSKMAGDVKAYMRSGSYSFKPAADGTSARKSRDVAKGYLRELCRAGQ